LWNSPGQNEHDAPQSAQQGNNLPDSVLEHIANSEVRLIASEFLKSLGSFQPMHITYETILWFIAIKVSGEIAAYLWPLQDAFAFTYRNQNNSWSSITVYDSQSYDDSLHLMRQVFTAAAENRTTRQ
jgi:hypothetical protein